MLPRKATGLRRSRESLEGVAFQIGVLLAIERNRRRLTQWDLAEEVGMEQIDISRLENGQPSRVTDAAVEALFDQLGLSSDSAVHANFVKWWRDNSTL